MLNDAVVAPGKQRMLAWLGQGPVADGFCTSTKRFVDTTNRFV